ncbi:type IV toxin-antitoxin system AbiEi family antitoxin [Ornithinimicrobium sp. LYQ121]|uniref:type IV toxin-antitoxin system AbiEi family antitoxin n=1 Tax=Ornithinimicrobium sp. LYQ121 TaxID=3378801 RepID=UPI0038538EF4
MNELEHALTSSVVKALLGEGLQASWHGAQQAQPPIDGKLDVRWSGGGHTFPAVVKHGLVPAAVGMLPVVDDGVVVTNYVSSKLRHALTDAGWGFVDACGNASLTAPGLIIRLEGGRPQKDVAPPIAAPFSRTGLPVTFVLLVRGRTGTQRELAATAKSSLGTTNRVLQGLRMLGYLSEDAEVRRPAALRDRWTEAFLVHRDALATPQRFTSDRWKRPHDVLQAKLPHGAYLGSEVAAAARGLSIRPETGLIYCSSPVRNEVIVQGRLRADPVGWLEIRSTFWSKNLLGVESQVVPDLLIRADLLSEADPRLTALARELARGVDS